MKPDRQGLQTWYREAMLRRIDELVDLRDPVASGAWGAYDALRGIGQSLRGSGGTFGFDELSVAAGVVESTIDAAALRRLEGLVVELRRLVGEMREEGDRRFEWLALCVDARGSAPSDALAEAVLGATSIEEAWIALSAASTLDDAGMARAVAERFGLEVADLTNRSRTAWRLVPEAFMTSHRVVPVVEDSLTITVATADPVSLPTELELRRLTGRRPLFVLASPAALGAVLDGLASAARSSEGGGDDGESEGRGGAVEPDRAAVSPGGAPPVGAGSLDRTGSSAEAAGSAVPEGPIGVLVVDDEASARMLVRSLLERRGFATIEAANGVEALEALGTHEHIGLAVVDLNMPRMDGLELMWELRDSPDWADLPVIVITGERDENLETQIMEEGADDYIRKPVDPRLFLARVEATLRRKGHPAMS